MKKLLEIKNISKYFQNECVLKNISFCIEKGTFTVILGASGSGKSTLLRIIAGLEKESQGKIIINSINLENKLPKQRDVAMVFQDYALYPHMTAKENIALTLKISKLKKTSINKKINDISNLLQINHLLHKYPNQLSGGQKQRVAIARAMVRNPQCFLFDEPLSNLDTKLRIDLKDEIKRCHQKLNTYTLYVTHDQEEALSLADQIIILDKGQIIQMDSPENIINYPTNLFVATFVNSPNYNIINTTIYESSSTLNITCNNKQIPLISLSSKLNLNEIIVGIRSEHIKISHKHSNTTIPLKVRSCEFTGSNWKVKGLINSNMISFYSDKKININTNINITLSPSHINIFNHKTLNRIIKEP